MTSTVLPDGLALQFKSTQFAKKGSWQTVDIYGLSAFCRTLKPKHYESGVKAMWLKPVLTDGDSRSYPWMLLDIESAGEDHHSDITANLEAGREFLRIICDAGLEIGLIIFLSGKGLRFCWPYLIPVELQKAFRAWITDKESFSMIDPTPFTKKSFYRLFANRSHRNQGKVLNRHIHRLPNIHDLWFLAETDYLELVTGTVDLKKSLTWLQEILPTSFVPEEWTEFLKEYKKRAALADTIFRPIIPVHKFRKPIAFLAEQTGFEFRQMQFEYGEILQLKVCPICGRRDGRPYVTEAGRLKCHHANSCAAGAFDEQGRIIGIPPDAWLPGELLDDLEPVMAEDTSERVTLDAARAELREAFEGEGDIFVELSPGAGKSFTMIQAVVAELDKDTGKVAIATPEHRLSQEFFDLARSMAKHPEKVYWLQGRNENNCQRIMKVEAVARAGYKPGIIVCMGCRINRDGKCGYFNQFSGLKTESDGLWLMTHALALEIDLAKYKFSLLVVDESPLNTFLQKLEAGLGAMQRIRSKMEFEGRTVMDKVLNVISEQLVALETEKASKYDLSRIYTNAGPAGSPWENQPSLWEVAGLTPGDMDQLDRALSFFQRFEGEKITEWQKRLYYDEKVDLTVLNWLWAGLVGEPGFYVRFQKDRKNPAKFISFQKKLPKHSGRVVCLDATGNVAELEALFERKFRAVQGRVLMPGLRTAWIKQASGKKVMSKMNDKKITSMLKSAVEFLNPNDKKVLIVTHMAVEESVKRVAINILPGLEVCTCHFWGGSRGVNEFEDCTAVIALGTPFPNIDGLFDHAMALMSSPAERVAWIVNNGTAELVQALHRVRPVKGDRTVIVVGRDFPIMEFENPHYKHNRGRGDKTGETSLREIFERLTPFVETWGFMTKEIAWAFNIYLEADKEKAIQAFEYIKNCIKEFERYDYKYLESLYKMDNDEKGNVPLRFYLLRTLIGRISSDTILNHHSLTLKAHSTWHNFLNLLGERFSLPKMTTLSTSTHGKQVHGIGHLSSVRKFLKAAHLPADSFKNIEGVTSPETEELKYEIKFPKK